MSSSAETRDTGRLTDSPNRLLAAASGGAFLLVGLVGFAVTGVGGLADTNTDRTILGLFEVNLLHNVAHLLIGAFLLAAARTGIAAAKAADVLVGAVYLLLGLVGLFVIDSDLNILSLNSDDNVLHLASAVLLLGVGLSQDKGVPRDATGGPGA